MKRLGASYKYERKFKIYSGQISFVCSGQTPIFCVYSHFHPLCVFSLKNELPGQILRPKLQPSRILSFLNKRIWFLARTLAAKLQRLIENAFRKKNLSPLSWCLGQVSFVAWNQWGTFWTCLSFRSICSFPKINFE